MSKDDSTITKPTSTEIYAHARRGGRGPHNTILALKGRTVGDPNREGDPTICLSSLALLGVEVGYQRAQGGSKPRRFT